MQIQGEPTSNGNAVHGYWVSSEGSLLLTVARNLDVKRNWRGAKGRGDKERTGEGFGGGSRRLLEEGRGG